jgi:hypothetical protein
MYKMAEAGCLRDASVQNLEVSGKLLSGSIPLSVRYLDYLAFNKTNLTATGVAITQSEGELALAADHTSTTELAAIVAATCVANAVNTFAGDGSAATEVYLPPATEGTHVCIQVTGDIDETGAVAIRCAPAAATTAGNDLYAGLFTIAAHILNSAAAVIPTGCVGSIRTAGTVAVPTATELIYTAAAANTNFLGINSEIHFYCPKGGQWIAKISATSEGTGATGALSVGTTALA